MLSDAHDGFESPVTLGGVSVGIHLFVAEADVVIEGVAVEGR